MSLSGSSSSLSSQSETNRTLTDFIQQYYHESELTSDKIEVILNNVRAIRQYAHETFRGQAILSDEEIVILTQSIFVPCQSPEKAIIDTDRNYMETKRALSRFYCIELLCSGDLGYEAFIKCQPQNVKSSPILSRKQYSTLSEKYRNLTPLELKILKVATLISSVPLSNSSRKRANEIFGVNEYVVDTVEFPAKMFENISHARVVYPQVDKLLNEHPDEHVDIISLISAMFPHHQHYRHMFFSEGNEGMYDRLIHAIKAGELTKKQFDMWVLYWNSNIAGFQGNVDPDGAYYLTSNVMRQMQALESSLGSLFDQPNLSTHDIFRAYLSQRANLLKLNDPDNTAIPLNHFEQLFLAHFGSKYSMTGAQDGQLLSGCYANVKNKMKDSLTTLRTTFMSPTPNMPTPTYSPALFTNVLDALKKRLEKEDIIKISRETGIRCLNDSTDTLINRLAKFEALTISAPITLVAYFKYIELRKEGKIKPEIPLSFQAIANSDWVKSLSTLPIKFHHLFILDLVDISISEQGAIVCQPKPDYDQQLAACRSIEGKPEPAITPFASLTMAYNRSREQAEPQQPSSSSSTISRSTTMTL